ncbi:KinB-signaling pathway activation protein [Cohnella caldifontis]|uniref:KinB-signaling pathway activation protein n=1 Tax=Cohnella caldifontis TaxID=3027471 RepID=UPI0023EB5596|nr:KinB-signaling pathway activation protein [Cohnella sp. YIM B05605]
MTLRKWMKLFATTILIGGAVGLLIGVCMMASDAEYHDLKADQWLYNMFNMAVAGLSFGAFAHMGFFAYMMLNYIARSIFKRPQMWVALQGFLALFILVEIAYWTYGTNFPSAVYWAVPLLLTAASLLVAWRKVRETNPGSWVPTMFFMIAVTTLEAIPAFRTGKLFSLVLELVPLFVCNAYQILRLHRILETRRPEQTAVKAG